jgi:ABC-2 type transport system ATP-binding protein
MSNASLHAPVQPVATTVAPAIDIRGLSKSYGDVHAVRGLDLTIAPGEIVAMLGPNGAGKSTTNELILGMIKPDAGSVRVFGLDPVRAVRSGQVGAMLQAGALLQEASVKDVLRLMHGLHAHPLPLAEIIERADLAAFLATKTDKLSGGQAQRLRYGLAIMPDPDLLILDEPTVGMDVEIRRSFWASMRDFTATGRTVLFATHYLDEADEVADRIVVLTDGRLVADGSGAQIKARVAGRTIAVATAGLDAVAVAALPGVLKTEIVGSRLLVHATDSDAGLRSLLRAFPQARDIEVTSAKLEDAFLAITAMEPS